MGSVMNGAGRTREINCRVSLAKAAFNKMDAVFNSKLDSKVRKTVVKNYF